MIKYNYFSLLGPKINNLLIYTTKTKRHVAPEAKCAAFFRASEIAVLNSFTSPSWPELLSQVTVINTENMTCETATVQL